MKLHSSWRRAAFRFHGHAEQYGLPFAEMATVPHSGQWTGTPAADLASGALSRSTIALVYLWSVPVLPDEQKLFETVGAVLAPKSCTTSTGASLPLRPAPILRPPRAAA